MRISDWSSDVCSSDLIDDQPGKARADRHQDRLVDVAFASTRQPQYVLTRFLLDDVNNVIDRNHDDQAAIAVDNSGCNQRIFLKTESYILMIHIHWDKCLLAFHYIGERNAESEAANHAH